MNIAPFELERYFAKYEFSSRYLLSASDCESLPMPELLAMADAETAGMWAELRLGYTESAGHPLLREAIAAMYAGIEARDTLVVVPEEGIFLLMHALLRPGDHVVCTFPGYQSLYEVARAIGCDVSTWEAHPAHQQAQVVDRSHRGAAGLLGGGRGDPNQRNRADPARGSIDGAERCR